MARTESRAFDAYFDPTWHGAGAPPRPRPPPFHAETQVPQERYKYFQRPLVEHLNPLSTNVLIAPSTKKEELDDGDARVKDAGTQSTYRESEAQTDPYTPAYVVPEGTDPEVLLLEHLKFGEGLPAGAREVEKIEQARAKRHLEANLPPATDECSLALRRRLLEWQEMKEFNIKQKEIDDAHARRLGLLRRALDERDQDREFMQEQRVDTLRQKRGEVRDRALESIQAQRIKTLRKLSLARGRLSQKEPYSAPTPVSNLTGKDARRRKAGRDIIAEYANYSSTQYAPITREGTKLDKDSHIFDVTRVAPHLNGHGLLNQLGDEPPARLTETIVKVPIPQAELPAKTAEDRHAATLRQDLATLTSVLEDERNPQAAADRKEAARLAALPAWSPSKTRVEEKDATPEKETTPEDEELAEAHAYFGNLLENVEQGRQSIRELRDAATTPATAAELSADDDKEARRRAVERGAADSIAGVVASSLLDYLSKELVREEEKEALAQLAKTADIERRAREQSEKDRREAEERVKARSDEAS